MHWDEALGPAPTFPEMMLSIGRLTRRMVASRMFRRLLPIIAVLALAGCTTSNPGALEGSWTATEPFPVNVTFRDGEMEAMGKTRKVSYKASGDEVHVTYLDGANKDRTFIYTVIDANTLRSDTGTFRRSQ